MRTITVPAGVVRAALTGKLGEATVHGSKIVVAVKVDWPELRLTEGQIIANALARANGHPPPHPDLQFINIELPIVAEGR